MRDAAILEALSRDGVVVLDARLDDDVIDAIRVEGAGLMERPPGWVRLTARPSSVEARIPIQRVQAGDMAQVEHTIAAFLDERIARIAHCHLGCRVSLERVLFHHSRPSPEPISIWHAGQEERGRRSVQLMIYLCDAGPENGAFCYLRGSHDTVGRLTAAALGREISNMQVHLPEQLRTLAVDPSGRAALGEAGASFLEDLDFSASDPDRFAIAAPRGSLILFDTRGVHRGGLVSNRERYIVRGHYFECAKTA